MFGARSLAMVASALSEEYGVTVTIGGNQAYMEFNSAGKPIINIPSLDIDDSYYKDLIRGYIDHETGHVRFSDKPDTNSRINKSGAFFNISNIYEDVYVERMMGDCFPGCRRNLRKLAKLIYASGEPGEGPDDPAPMHDALQNYKNGYISNEEFIISLWAAIFNYILYRSRGQISDRIEEYVPKYKKVIDDLLPGLSSAIDPIIDRLPIEGINTAANNALAIETEEAIKNYINQNEQAMEDYWKEEQSDQDSDQDSVQGSSQGSGVGSSTSIVNGFNKIEGTIFENEEHLDISKLTSERICKTVDNSREEHTIKIHNISTFDDPSLFNIGILSDEEVKNSLQSSVVLDTQLQSLLQTYTLNRGGLSRVGKLNTNRLHKLSVCNDRIFTRKIEKRSINTEIIILVDMSGSMIEKNKDVLTSKSLYAIINSLRKIKGCVSSIVGFSSTTVVDILKPNDRITRRMKIVPYGGTLCGEALTQAVRRFSSSPDSRKIVIMLTDGNTDNFQFFERVIKVTKASGIEIVGIGIMDSNIKRYLQSDECCIINNLSQMTGELFRILRSKLLGLE